MDLPIKLPPAVSGAQGLAWLAQVSVDYVEGVWVAFDSTGEGALDMVEFAALLRVLHAQKAKVRGSAWIIMACMIVQSSTLKIV